MATAKKKKVAARPGGVIAKIIDTIGRANGASIADRSADAMRGTARIQASKNSTSREKDEKRGGMVYYKRR